MEEPRDWTLSAPRRPYGEQEMALAVSFTWQGSILFVGNGAAAVRRRLCSPSALANVGLL